MDYPHPASQRPVDPRIRTRPDAPASFKATFEDDGTPFGWKDEFSRHFKSLQPFTYEPLQRDRSIRLMRLKSMSFSASSKWDPWYPNFTTSHSTREDHQGSLSTETIRQNENPLDYGFYPIEVSLVEAPLDSLPLFETLSYVWGGSASPRAIICDGRLFRISRNCMLALYYIAIGRKSAADILLWVDQICINQADLTEKMDQVGFMPLIYGNSARTIGWLGEPATPTRNLFQIHRRSLDEFRGHRSFNPVRSDDLEYFAAQSFFKRGWIVQEAALSQSMGLLCGEFEIPWKFLVSFQTACEGQTNSALTGRFLRSNAITRFITLRTPDGDRDGKKLNLTEALKLGFNVSVEDERDRFYALFGLSDELREYAGPPDYSITTAEVWTRLFLSLLRRYGPDSCLLWQIINNYTTENSFQAGHQDHLPSWMPDFRNGPPEQHAKCLSSIRTIRDRCCAPSTTRSALETTKPPIGEIYTPVSLSHWTLSCQSSFIAELTEVLWPTVRDFVRSLQQSATVREQTRAYTHVPEYDPIGTLFNIVGDPVSRFPGLSTALPFGNAPEWNHMKVFATLSQKLAIAPNDACIGDRVVLFSGNAHSDQLSVVRKNGDDTYRYVGTAFISGKMKPLKANETIVLR